MKIIGALKKHVASCPLLAAGALVHVGMTGPEPVNYSVGAVPGTRTVVKYLSGARTVEYPYTVSLSDYTIEDVDRLRSLGFFEDFAYWLETHPPDLGAGREAECNEATNWAYLFEQDSGAQTGIYQIQCKLTYYEEAK